MLKSDQSLCVKLLFFVNLTFSSLWDSQVKCIQPYLVLVGTVRSNIHMGKCIHPYLVKGTVSLDVHSQVYLSLLVLVLMVQSIQTCESICIHLYIYCINGTISSDMRKWIHPCIIQVRISIVGSDLLDMQEFIHPPSCIMYNYGIGFSLEYFFVIWGYSQCKNPDSSICYAYTIYSNQPRLRRLLVILSHSLIKMFYYAFW